MSSNHDLADFVLLLQALDQTGRELQLRFHLGKFQRFLTFGIRHNFVSVCHDLVSTVFEQFEGSLVHFQTLWVPFVIWAPLTRQLH